MCTSADARGGSAGLGSWRGEGEKDHGRVRVVARTNAAMLPAAIPIIIRPVKHRDTLEYTYTLGLHCIAPKSVVALCVILGRSPVPSESVVDKNMLPLKLC